MPMKLSSTETGTNIQKTWEGMQTLAGIDPTRLARNTSTQHAPGGSRSNSFAHCAPPGTLPAALRPPNPGHLAHDAIPNLNLPLPEVDVRGGGGRGRGRARVRDRQEKDNRKEAERHRRGNIKKMNDELGRIVPCGPGDTAKTAIISHAVQYIHQLRQNETRDNERCEPGV
ncbi:hypothetical protein B0H13DRAFT_2308126 [Mycena leptocephala]|nr:hypothetical protein B0H13DRAFT_2308126 [Mycena leptocephala]